LRYGRNLSISVGIMLAHRLRTLLSVAGVVVGVAAITVIVSVGNGIRDELVEGFRSMGSDMVVVRAGRFHSRGGHAHQTASFTTLVPEDAEALARMSPDVLAAGAAISRPLVVKKGTLATQSTVDAVSLSAVHVRNLTVSSGRLFRPEEMGVRRTVAVLGAAVAENLFFEEDPIGWLVTVGRLPFQVIGVARRLGTDINGSDQDNVVYIPLDTGMRRVFHTTYVETVYVKGTSGDSLAGIETASRELLRKRHKLRDREDDDFTVQNQLTMLSTALETSDATTRLVAGVGGICLVVAGIGVLAVMLMSVRERRGEIGLRRAIGARRSDILLQFLSEAALLTVSGGIIGLATGAGAVAIRNFFGWARADFSLEAASLAFAVSVTVGVVFGIYPAHKASRLDPAVALTSAT